MDWSSILNACQIVNNNKFMSGCTMLLLNLGSKYVIADLGLAHEKILTNEFTKKVIILSMFFVATRDIIVSFLLTIIYIVVIDGMLHENRRFSLLTDKFKKSLDKKRKSPTDAEYIEAENIVSQYQQLKATTKREYQ